jgi:hypothetical protein
MNSWYVARDIDTGKTYFVSKGFGSDGNTIAVCDPKLRYNTGDRLSQDECRERFVLVRKLSEIENKEFDDNFMYELHR